MQAVSVSILHQLTTALSRKDIFHIGYLLMAYSGVSEEASELKNKFISWLAMETLASVPHDIERPNKNSVYCIDSAGAIVSFLRSYLNSTLAPIQYVLRVKSAGEFLTKHFASIDNTQEVCLEKQETVETITYLSSKIKRIGLANNPPTMRILYLPACGVRTEACVFVSNCTTPSEQTIAIPETSRKGMNTLELSCWVFALSMAQCCQTKNGNHMEPNIKFPSISVLPTASGVNKSKLLEIKKNAGIIYQSITE